MKLTNYIRDAFIRSVMADVPSVDYDEQISKAFREAAVSLMPPKLRAMLKDKDCEPFINYEYRGTKSMRRNLSVPSSRHSEDFKLPADAVAAIDALIDKSAAQSVQRSDLERKIRGVAYGVTTRKALADALPEFVKYLPADEPAAIRQLPVVANVVADFVKAGWPKGGKKNA